MEGLHTTVQVGVKGCSPKAVDFFTCFELYIPEFCKGLCKKCPENRMNSGVQGISEMYKTVVFFLVF